MFLLTPAVCSASLKAHQGAVISLVPCPDGLFWFSAGLDARMRLWDAGSWHNTLVAFHGVGSSSSVAAAATRRAQQLAVSWDGQAVFQPQGDDVLVYDVRSGRQINTLGQGHDGAVGSCAFKSETLELFTGGEDGRILQWALPNED